jgi:hypothetical protein
MDSLENILQTKRFDEPPEVLVIKTFVQTHYQADCHVTMQTSQIIIAVKGSSLAGALRMRLHELQVLCQTDKRLAIRIV